MPAVNKSFFIGSFSRFIGIFGTLCLAASIVVFAGATRFASQAAPTQPTQGGGMRFTEPSPLDFNDHDGYASLFDGVSLKGWDGNPKFWRVEQGAIVGESTPSNPSGNSYLVYRDLEAKDFTLKCEIKIEGDGGSGIQYRSRTGLPWLANIPANVTANVGPVNLNWMMTGPQADFWPSRVYTGQFYSENTPMRILAWRGQVVEGFGARTKKLIGTIGDRAALGSLVRMNDWNQYTVIARGGTFLHVVNGQLMAAMIDDDPDSSNNQPGLFGIEIEATTKVSVRSFWVKNLQDRFPEGPGKMQLTKVCGSCHDSEIVLATLETPTEWSDTLQNMTQQGADATPEEWRLIEQYLDAKLALIAINKAGAGELKLTMEATPDVAAAIVKYRQDNGAFKSVDDVKKVPGIDAAAVEARKNRFVF
ncbi:MAG TPA: family 16 glycoside hydrolase [Vicinamibacterales bacterium]|nr:family 16 glycoside hydrolase [Vicinamibacterales bacterium]